MVSKQGNLLMVLVHFLPSLKAIIWSTLGNRPEDNVNEVECKEEPSMITELPYL